VVSAKEGGLAGGDLITPLTRVLVSTAVMAVATVLAVNVSGATSDGALFVRVVLGVVVGVVSFVGTTLLMGAREERRTIGERADRAEARRAAGSTAPVGPEVPNEVVADTPRERATFSSIRLVTPDTDTAPGAAGPGTAVAVPPPTDHGASGSSPIPFRGRLDPGSDTAPVRHLRPVPGGRGSPPPGGPGDGRTAGTPPTHEPGAPVPPDDEE
jgi:hypothetical protein